MELPRNGETPRIWGAVFWLLAITGCTGGETPPDGARSLFIANVNIVDGTGSAPFSGSVRVADGVIKAIGDIETKPGDELFHGNGLVLAPGFIDTHSHADQDIFDRPDAFAAVSQGITTAVVGQDGRSPFPLEEFAKRVENLATTVNVAAYVGHNTLRNAVMGVDAKRTASRAEVDAMTALLRTELRAGAIGLSTGLEYEPGLHSATDEVIALASATAALGGRYISHLRSEDRWLDEAVEEIIEIGRVTGMPVQISHVKLAMKGLWGHAPRILQRLDTARRDGIDITADIYPYPYWQSTMMVLLPERDPNDRDAASFALRELAPPDGIWFTRYDPHPDYVGMTLSAVAAERESDPVTAYMELAATAQQLAAETGDSVEAIIGTSMSEDDIDALLTWEHSNVATDGGLDDLHPRAFGTYARVLGRYVRERRVLDLPTAVRKMTGLAADHLGLRDRGYVRVGQAADLILFDPESIIDRATAEKPDRPSEGIAAVWVAGQLVFLNGRVNDARPGVFLRRADRARATPDQSESLGSR